MEPGRVTFDDKMVVRKAIQDAGIPFTFRVLGIFDDFICIFNWNCRASSSLTIYI